MDQNRQEQLEQTLVNLLAERERMGVAGFRATVRDLDGPETDITARRISEVDSMIRNIRQTLSQSDAIN